MSALVAYGGPVEAVFLDVGGVFHLPNHEIVAAALRRAGSEPDGALFDRAHYAGVAALVEWPGGDEGIWTAYEEAYVSALGVPPGSTAAAVTELDRAFRAPGIWSRLAPGSLDGLRALQATGVALAIVSNSDGTLEGRLHNEAICQVGDGPGVPMTIVIDSGAVGVAKPDPAIFAIALDACGVTPEVVLHIGDTVGADVEGALAAGIRPIHLDPYGFCTDPGHAHAPDLSTIATALGASAP